MIPQAFICRVTGNDPTVHFQAVLFDRDGTLIANVPYNGDPAAVVPVPGARAALDRLRAAGLPLAVITNQSGIARGLLDADAVNRVNARVEALLGPFASWHICPHAPDDGCRCRKPAPGLIHAAARALGTTADRCVVVGDVGADMAAAAAAGAAAILVPNEVTRREEVAAAPVVAGDLGQAVHHILRRERLIGIHHWSAKDRQARAGTEKRHTAWDDPQRSVVDAGTVVAGRRTAAAGFAASGARRSRADPTRHRPLSRLDDSLHQPTGPHVIAVRGDSAGDVLVTGPAIRALAAGARRVTLLCGPRGRAAAGLLPGVDEVITWPAPWLDPRPHGVDPNDISALVARLAAVRADQAVIFTSFHQSSLPYALLLRLAEVPRVAAISDDYPGALLDIRHRVPLGIPEPERALSLAAAAGYRLPPGDDGRLRVRTAPFPRPAPRYVIVHPGTSVPARACAPERCAAIVRAIASAGRRVVVTGSAAEREITARVAKGVAIDLGGQTTLAQLAWLIAGADCLVVGNTGPAHLAAAVGTPVVSLFAPTVPFGQWGPYRVGTVRLGDPLAPCRNTRVNDCPYPGHPCLDVSPERVRDAVDLLVSAT